VTVVLKLQAKDGIHTFIIGSLRLCITTCMYFSDIEWLWSEARAHQTPCSAGRHLPSVACNACGFVVFPGLDYVSLS